MDAAAFDDSPLETCSLITTDANKLAEKSTHRMPVILETRGRGRRACHAFQTNRDAGPASSIRIIRLRRLYFIGANQLDPKGAD
jgi:hypothetical protein